MFQIRKKERRRELPKTRELIRFPLNRARTGTLAACELLGGRSNPMFMLGVIPVK